MKIGITGSRGFIGKNLLKKLISHNVVEFKGDITNIEDVKRFTSKEHDIIFHLAGKMAKYDQNGNDIVESYQTNTVGTNNIAECVLKTKTKVIFSSSVAVYGPKSRIPFTESDVKLPITKYGKSKFQAESILKDKLEGKNDFAILRFSNIYGGYPEQKRLIENMMESVLKEKPLKINLNPSSKRDFIHINDVLESLQLAIHHNGIFNIGFGESYSLNDVNDLIQKLVGKKAELVYDSNASPFSVILDIKKAKSKMNFNPKVGLMKGIKNEFQK